MSAQPSATTSVTTSASADAPQAALSDLPLKQAATVEFVGAPLSMPEWGPWLEQIGFLPGERVELLARAAPGGDPLVVRVGDSTFALRRAEAACVRVRQAPVPAR
jgi:ferrous iron transport protein A